MLDFPSVATVRLVALTSWQFTCEGPGTFRDLMHNLDTCDVRHRGTPGTPPLTDTGHMPLDFAGSRVPQKKCCTVARSCSISSPAMISVPYHSADQARRVTPESGTEDISYAAAFEVGRLLAAADRRLAQATDAMAPRVVQAIGAGQHDCRWSLRVDLDLPATPADQLHTPIAPRAATAATAAVTTCAQGWATRTVWAASPGAGLNAAALAVTWQLPSAATATALLGGDPGTLGTPATQRR